MVGQQQRHRFRALTQPIQQIERRLPGIGGEDAVGLGVPVTQVALDSPEHFRIVAIVTTAGRVAGRSKSI
jgi:hypothetical protein